jgi:hypothetical protein
MSVMLPVVAERSAACFGIQRPRPTPYARPNRRSQDFSASKQRRPRSPERLFVTDAALGRRQTFAARKAALGDKGARSPASCSPWPRPSSAGVPRTWIYGECNDSAGMKESCSCDRAQTNARAHLGIFGTACHRSAKGQELKKVSGLSYSSGSLPSRALKSVLHLPANPTWKL